MKSGVFPSSCHPTGWQEDGERVAKAGNSTFRCSEVGVRTTKPEFFDRRDMGRDDLVDRVGVAQRRSRPVLDHGFLIDRWNVGGTAGPLHGPRSSIILGTTRGA